MKIVLIPSADLSYNSGSIIYAKSLFEYLLDNGQEVMMIGSCIPNDIKDKYKKYIKVGKKLLFHPIIDDRYISDLQYFDMYLELMNIILDIKDEWGEIDVIHAHYASINSYVAMQIKDMFNIPYVVSCFGRDINIGYYCDDRIKDFIVKSLKRANKIIVSDYNIKQKIQNQVVYKKDDIFEIVPMPLDNKIFEESNFSLIEDDKLNIVTINSCFTPEKGIETILYAFKKVRCKYKCKLYIAGADDDDKKQNYKNLCRIIKKLSLEDDVVFLGYLSRNDVGKLLELADIFIDARIKGNFSSVLLEAQFKNCVTISSDNVAARKIITDKENGFIFPAGNKNKLAETIFNIIDDKKKITLVKKNMSNWCEEFGSKYKEENCMKQVLEAFKFAIRS